MSTQNNHSQQAKNYIDSVSPEGDRNRDAIAALVGIGHALLAINETLRAQQALSTKAAHRTTFGGLR